MKRREFMTLIGGAGGRLAPRAAQVWTKLDHRFLPALRSSTEGYLRFLRTASIPSMMRSWILRRSWKAVPRRTSYTGSGR